jgi:uncharacterized membrane protein YvbJ
MDVCASCGHKLNEYTQFCTNCNSRVRQAKKRIGLRKKRFVAGVGAVIGLLIVFGVAYFIVNAFTHNEHQTDVAARKTIVQPKNNHLDKSRESSKEKKPALKTSSENKKPSLSNYILPDSDKKFLSEGDIASLTKEELRLARNEIYARHGYVFKSADLQKYFSSKPWYHANPAYHNSLSKIEIKNSELLSARESQM